jgi:hypothetical protein
MGVRGDSWTPASHVNSYSEGKPKSEAKQTKKRMVSE